MLALEAPTPCLLLQHPEALGGQTPAEPSLTVTLALSNPHPSLSLALCRNNKSSPLVWKKMDDWQQTQQQLHLARSEPCMQVRGLEYRIWL